MTSDERTKAARALTRLSKATERLSANAIMMVAEVAESLDRGEVQPEPAPQPPTLDLRRMH